MFWIVQIPDDAVVISGNTLTIHVANLAIADEIAFLGTVRIPSTLSFDITYTKSGMPGKIVPDVAGSAQRIPLGWRDVEGNELGDLLLWLTTTAASSATGSLQLLRHVRREGKRNERGFR